MNKPQLIVALDYAHPGDALRLTDNLDKNLCRLKVGKELFCRGGPGLVETLVKQGFDVFLDLKFHDIPNTVAQACVAAADMGVWMLNVHALGGRKMMEAACAALQARPKPPLIIAVTILTSLEQEDLGMIGLTDTVEQNVLRLAALARHVGLDGVVCSAREAQAIRTAIGQPFYLVAPGIRPLTAGHDDQKRTLTPADAIRAGADFLVVGRPITAAANPLRALQAIQSEIDNAVIAA